MGSEVDFQPFASLLSNVVDNRGRTCPTAPSGIPLIATNCVANDSLYPSYDTVRYVDEQTYRTWFRGHPEPGDFLFVLKGSPGRVCLVPDPVDFCIAQDMVAIRADPRRVYPRFLFALLRSAPVQRQIEQLHVGTMIPHFKKGDFDKLLLPLPSRSVQEYVGDVYWTLSQKIDLNRRMSQTLESVARALFKSWFVDFDPVRAKAEGRDTGLSQQTANLFPNSLDASDMGPLPKGWSIGALGDVATEWRRAVRPADLDPKTPYVGLEHMPRHSISLPDWGISGEVESGKLAFRRGDILFGKLRPYFHKVVVAPMDGVCSTDIVTLGPNTPKWFGFVLGHVASDAFVESTTARSTGTKMPRTNWGDMAKYRVVLPDDRVADAYSREAAALVSRAVDSAHECHALTAIRDSLLPGLMSGDLPVRPVDGQVLR